MHSVCWRRGDLSARDDQNIWICREQHRSHVKREKKELDLNSKNHTSAAVTFMQYAAYIDANQSYHSSVFSRIQTGGCSSLILVSTAAPLSIYQVQRNLMQTLQLNLPHAKNTGQPQHRLFSPCVKHNLPYNGYQVTSYVCVFSAHTLSDELATLHKVQTEPDTQILSSHAAQA